MSEHSALQLDEFYMDLQDDGSFISLISPRDVMSRPFPGLRPFRTSESQLYYGRRNETVELVSRLQNNRFLTVIGSSGTGKSSLVRAGLLPELFGGYLYNKVDKWRVAICRPGKNPIENLAVSFSQIFAGSRDRAKITAHFPEVNSRLTKSVYGILEVEEMLNAIDQGETNTLIVIDQFEELFRIKRDDLKKPWLEGHFVNLLLNAAQVSNKKIYIVITMRSEFLGPCIAYSGLPEVINAGQYLVPQMTRLQLKEAITGPILQARKRIDATFVDKLINEVEEKKQKENLDQLPILQHAMQRTYARAMSQQIPDVDLSREFFIDFDRIKPSSAGNQQYDLKFQLNDSEDYRTRNLVTNNLYERFANGDSTLSVQSFYKSVSSIQGDERKLTQILNSFRNIQITEEHYIKSGGISYALAMHAESKYRSLGNSKQEADLTLEEFLKDQTLEKQGRPSRDQEIARVVFQALIDLSSDQQGGRRPTPLKDIYEMARAIRATHEEVDEVVNHFRDMETSFIMPPINTRLHKNLVLDISHESLTRNWPTLEKWGKAEATNIASYQYIRKSAEVKGYEGRLGNVETEVGDKLLQDPYTVKILSTRDPDNFEKVRSYIEKSKRIKNLIVLAVFAGAIALAGFTAVFLSKSQENAELKAAQDKSDSLANVLKVALEESQLNEKLAKQNEKLANDNSIKANEQKELADLLAKKERARSFELAAQTKLATQNAKQAELNAMTANRRLQDTRLARDSALAYLDSTRRGRDFEQAKNLGQSVVFLTESSAKIDTALRAYELNKSNNGPKYQPEIYQGMINALGSGSKEFAFQTAEALNSSLSQNSIMLNAYYQTIFQVNFRSSHAVTLLLNLKDSVLLSGFNGIVAVTNLSNRATDWPFENVSFRRALLSMETMNSIYFDATTKLLFAGSDDRLFIGEMRAFPSKNPRGLSYRSGIFNNGAFNVSFVTGRGLIYSYDHTLYLIPIESNTLDPSKKITLKKYSTAIRKVLSLPGNDGTFVITTRDSAFSYNSIKNTINQRVNTVRLYSDIVSFEDQFIGGDQYGNVFMTELFNINNKCMCPQYTDLYQHPSAVKAVTSSGRFIFSISNSVLLVWVNNDRTRFPMRINAKEGEKFESLATSNDGRYVYVGTDLGNIYRYPTDPDELAQILLYKISQKKM